MRKRFAMFLACGLAANARALEFVDPYRSSEPGSLTALDPAEAVPFPDWVPVSTRGNATGGRTNVLGLAARWVFPPPWGRPGIVEIEYSNRLDRAFLLECGLQPHGLHEPSGMLLFRLGADGGMLPLAGFPRYDQGLLGSAVRTESGGARRVAYLLPTETLTAAAGSEGLVVAYAGRSGEVAYWAAAAPLCVPTAAEEPGVAGTNEWAGLKAGWLARGLLSGQDAPLSILKPYPEFARFYPGVVLDNTLPEDFRVGFAAYMPPVDVHDPAVVTFVTNAVDKTAPLVIAALRVLSRCGGATPEEKADLRASTDAIRALSLDAQLPLLFRLHVARLFPVQLPYKEFRDRSEAHFKLLAADALRAAQGTDFANALRTELREGLTALLSDTTPFVAGPMAGRYPENATVGQVATIILADLETKWAAEPSCKD